MEIGVDRCAPGAARHKEFLMHPGKFERFLPLAGVLTGLLAIAAIGLTGSEPDGDASKAKILAYYNDHHSAIVIGALVLSQFAALFLLFFVAGLRSAIRSGEPGESSYSTVVTVGGTVAALGISLSGMLGAAAAKAADAGADVTVVQTLHFLASEDWLPIMLGFAVMLIAAGLGGLRTLALPRALSWVTLVLGVLAATPVGVLAYFLIPFWFIAAGIVLARRGRAPAGMPAVATA
jgi:hypothetical protein